MPIDHIDFERIVADCRLSLWQKFLVYLGLKVKAYDIPSTSNPRQTIQFYYAHCKHHGYFVGYEHGFNLELRCSVCMDEIIRERRIRK